MSGSNGGTTKKHESTPKLRIVKLAEAFVMPETTADISLTKLDRVN
jgi:hypothetical protein